MDELKARKILNALAKKLHGDAIVNIDGYVKIVKNIRIYGLYKSDKTCIIWVPIQCKKSNVEILNSLIENKIKPSIEYELFIRQDLNPISIYSLEQLIIDLEIEGYLE